MNHIPTLTIGMVIGVIDLLVEVSFAACIFAGPLSAYIPAGVGMMLVAPVIVCLVVMLLSSLPISIVLPQDIPAAILALVAAGITQAVRGATSDAIFATVVTTIALTAFLSGATFFLLGYFRFWNIVSCLQVRDLLNKVQVQTRCILLKQAVCRSNWF